MIGGGLERVLGLLGKGLSIQERERGITINAAAITFNWKQHRINLIDTPGGLAGRR